MSSTFFSVIFRLFSGKPTILTDSSDFSRPHKNSIFILARKRWVEIAEIDSRGSDVILCHSQPRNDTMISEQPIKNICSIWEGADFVVHWLLHAAFIEPAKDRNTSHRRLRVHFLAMLCNAFVDRVHQRRQVEWILNPPWEARCIHLDEVAYLLDFF